MKHILILILCAFVLSCKSTKTASSSNESERNAVSQAQWRSAQNLSFSSLQCLTALSFDSCVFTFGGVDTSATPQCSDLSYPSGKPLSNDKAKPPSYHGKPSAISHGKPSSLRLYGLHLSQENMCIARINLCYFIHRSKPLKLSLQYMSYNREYIGRDTLEVFIVKGDSLSSIN